MFHLGIGDIFDFSLSVFIFVGNLKFLVISGAVVCFFYFYFFVSVVMFDFS